MKCTLLFVYGTLLRRSPHPMARYLAERGDFLGEASIPARLYNLGRFPGMTKGAPNELVFGDLYDLGADLDATITALDQYERDESTPSALFVRELGEVTCTDGERVQAWVYWFRGEVEESQRIASGRYLE